MSFSIEVRAATHAELEVYYTPSRWVMATAQMEEAMQS